MECCPELELIYISLRLSNKGMKEMFKCTSKRRGRGSRLPLESQEREELTARLAVWKPVALCCHDEGFKLALAWLELDSGVTQTS